MRKAMFIAVELLMLGVILFFIMQEKTIIEMKMQKGNTVERKINREESHSTVTQSECLLCSDTASVFVRDLVGEKKTEGNLTEETPLFLCNVNSGICIDLLLGNPYNSGNDRKKGRRELHFPEGEETTVRILSLCEKDLCEVTMYLNENSSKFEGAEDRLCETCLKEVRQGQTEFVLCSQKEKTVHLFQEGTKLFFAGDYGVHLDWKKESKRIDILIFYSPNMSCAGRGFVL